MAAKKHKRNFGDIAGEKDGYIKKAEDNSYPDDGSINNSTLPKPVKPGFHGDYSYVSKHILDEIMNKSSMGPEDFNEDPFYRHYKGMYEKSGSDAAKNIYGLASSMTGGYGNSYAATAAGNVFSGYMDDFQDKFYKHKENELDNLYKMFGFAGEIADRDYKYYKDSLEREDKTRKEKSDFAFDAAKTGDYSFLKAMGFDTSAAEEEKRREKAEFLAKYGDTSGLADMGVDLSKLSEKDLYNVAQIYAKYGDYSLLEGLGVDTSVKSKEDYYKNLVLYSRYLKNMYG